MFMPHDVTCNQGFVSIAASVFLPDSRNFNRISSIAASVFLPASRNFNRIILYISLKVLQ